MIGIYIKNNLEAKKNKFIIDGGYSKKSFKKFLETNKQLKCKVNINTKF